LLRRAFGIEDLVHLRCSDLRRGLAAIRDPGAIARVLVAMVVSSSAAPE